MLTGYDWGGRGTPYCRALAGAGHRLVSIGGYNV